MEQVGPDFGFHADENHRFNPREKTPYHKGQIIRKVKMRDLIGKMLFDRGGPGRGDRGDQYLKITVVFKQVFDQRPAGVHFANGYGMQPDNPARRFLPG